MPERDTQTETTLRRECDVFTRYLLGTAPDEYLVDKYVSMQSCITPAPCPRRLDAAVLSLGRSGVLGARIADAYSRFFLPRATLRRKLILVLALAENSREFHRLLTSGGTGRALGAVASLAASATVFAVALLIGFAVFTPLRLLSGDGAGPEHSR